MVYLGEGTDILAKDELLNEDVQAVEASRLAVINYDDGSILSGEEEVALIYTPEIDGDNLSIFETECRGYRLWL
jgi:hypothetical protein